jgi:DNA-binding transcriptional LysR family regulator
VPNTARVNQQRSMNCRFDDILTFINVLEAGSITSAAARLNVSKSAISRRISDLEAALRVELFGRSTRHVKPTELAQSFYERIVPWLSIPASIMRTHAPATCGDSTQNPAAKEHYP